MPAAPPPAAARSGALVLLNPLAGGGRAARLLAPLQQALQGSNDRLLVAPSVAAAEAELARWSRGSRVVLAGGDGTLHRLLPAVLAQGHELALLPCGTGNDTARAWGLHRLRWSEALAVARTAPARPTDLGEVKTSAGRTPFLSSLCVGFDGAVCERAMASPPWLSGMPRYLWATLTEMASLSARQLRVHADGALVHEGAALFASVLNTPTYGSGMPVVPGATIDDGRLNLLLAGRFGRLGALAMMPLLMTSQHLRHPRVRTLPFSELRVSSAAPVPLAADGEVLPAAPEIGVRVLAGALQAVRA